MTAQMGRADWAMIALYLLVIAGIGAAASLRKRKDAGGSEGSNYFLAG